MGSAVEGWYRVDVYIDAKLIGTYGFRLWNDANRKADELEEKYPKADVQLWSRER